MENEDLFAQIWTGVWVTFWALFGGILHYVNSVRDEENKWQKFKFFADLLVAAAAGWLTYALCKWAKIDPNLSSVLIGVSGHMGTRCIFLAERFVVALYDKTAKVILSDEDLKEYEKQSKGSSQTDN